MAHDHDHGGSARRAGARHQGRLLAALVVLAVFMVVEVATALLTHSLGLLSDAGHMVTDVVGLGMAVAAIRVASRGREHPQRTFGLYRLEILAALANAVLLFGVAGYIAVEAVRRLSQPTHVITGPVLVVALLAVAANLVAFALLRGGAADSLNVRAAYLEVMSDTIGSVGVVVGAVVLRYTGWSWVDPVVGIAIGVFILPRTWKLAGQAIRILVQAAPPGVDLDGITSDLRSLGGVVDVHDLHVWTLTSDMEVASAHLMVSNGTDAHRVLDEARDLMVDRYEITHATFQVEPEDHEGCQEVSW
ncbi:MAG TPA: cation diffusion facilitator family transporter [Acidimicrobiales bacterium]